MNFFSVWPIFRGYVSYREGNGINLREVLPFNLQNSWWNLTVAFPITKKTHKSELIGRRSSPQSSKRTWIPSQLARPPTPKKFDTIPSHIDTSLWWECPASAMITPIWVVHIELYRMGKWDPSKSMKKYSNVWELSIISYQKSLQLQS